MSKLLANEDRTYSVTPGGGATWTPSLSGFLFNETKSPHCKILGKKILKQLISWTVGSGCVDPLTLGFVDGSGSMSPANITKVKCEGDFPFTVDDQGTCNGRFLLSVGPPPVYLYCNCVVKISNAGQTKVKGT